MKQKPIIPRELANRDVDNAIAYYLEEQAEKAALGFIDALERAYKQVLDLPALRSWPLQRYPYLVFYIEQEGHIDVWRVLHQMKDLPKWLSTSEEG